MKNHAHPSTTPAELQALRRAARQARRGLPPLVRRAEAKAAAAAFAPWCRGTCTGARRPWARLRR